MLLVANIEGFEPLAALIEISTNKFPPVVLARVAKLQNLGSAFFFLSHSPSKMKCLLACLCLKQC